MMGHRFFKSADQRSLRSLARRRRDLTRYARRNNLRVETLESRIAMYAATIDLLAVSDSGASNTDNVTNAPTWSIQVSDVVEGTTVNLRQGGNVVATGTVATGATTIDFTLNAATVTGFADGAVSLVAEDNANLGDFSTALVVTKDTIVADFTSTAPTTGVAGTLLSYNAVHPEEAATGTEYSLIGGAAIPSGAAIDAATGVLTWTPNNTQIDSFGFQIQFKDLAGNLKTQDVNLVIAPPATAAPDLQDGSDSGLLATDNITKSNSLLVDVGSVVAGATVKLYRNGTLIDTQVASGTSQSFTVDMSAQADGVYTFKAVQEVDGVASAESTVLSITRDATVPADLTSVPPTTASIGVQLSYNAAHAEEGTSGFKYSLTGAPAGAAIDADTGVLTWTPGSADAGASAFQIVVTDAAGNTKSQSLNLNVAPPAPSTPDLKATSDSGLDTDNITKTTSWSIDVAGVIVGASVRLYRNGTVVNTIVASSTTVTFVLDMAGPSDGTYNFTADQTVEGIASQLSTALPVVKDTNAPVALSSTAPTTALAGTLFTYDAAHVDEGVAGFKYSLTTSPAGATINADTGVVSWTPNGTQLGNQNFVIQVSDLAGNTNSQSFTLGVTDPSAAAQDLVAFAKALTAAGAIMYGAAWCPHCTATKNLFQDGADFLNFVEVTNFDANKTLNAVGIANNITTYPTWVFANGTRITGEQTLEAISAASGVAIPTGVTPSLAPLPNVTLLHDSPLSIPLNGYDPNGGPLTYEISVANPAILSATQLDNTNRSVRITVQNWGDIVLYLFEDEASNVTSKFITLAQNNTYDNTIFHRVIDGFMMQGGDPNGNGQNDENQTEFDDQFNLNLQHNRSGILSMAKLGDDSNTSQFFITDAAARHLDFNHSIFGQLTEGDKVRDAITKMGKDANDKPVFDVKIQDVQVFVDTENGMLRLKAASGVTSGSTQITVTVKDAQGNSAQQSFTATIAQDTNNTPPFLGPVNDLTATAGVASTLQLSSTDLQGNAVVYDILTSSTAGKPFTATVNANTGLVTFTPNANFVGTTSFVVRVRSATPLNLFANFDEYDSQEVSVTVNAPAPTGIDLLDASDSGVSNTDNLTKATSWQLNVTGVLAGAMVQLKNGSTNIGSPVQVPTGATSVLITIPDTSVLGADGPITLTAVQTINGSTSTLSAPLTVTKDTTAPDAITSTAPTAALVGQPFTYDATQANEGQTGFLYSLLNPPAGATINATTGQITWTPTAAQVGAQAFSVQMADPAGNTVTQNLNISVLSDQSQLVQFSVVITNLAGDTIDSIEQGEDFLVQVWVKDNRATPAGVFAAFADMTYNQSLVTANGQIVHHDSFPNATSGNLTTPGLVDEAGGSAGMSGLGAGEFKVFSLKFKANAIGNATFATDPADGGTSRAVLLFGVGAVIPTAQITHASSSLTITAPTGAVADQFTVVEESTNNEINPLSNDTLPSGVTGTLTIASITQPATGGTVTISGDNTRLIFTPSPNFAGETTFTYTITNSAGFTDTATVRMLVTNVNDPPTATNDAFTVDEDAANTTLNVLGNDSFTPDPTDTLTITGVSTTSAGGTVTIGANGANLIYKPAANFNGTETFTYTITDSGGLTSTATVTMTVTAVNDNPTAGADTKTVAEDSDSTTIDVLANDAFTPDVGETLTVTAVSTGNKGGTITVGTNGANVNYKPAANFTGTETFTYTVSDGHGGTATGTVTVTVTSVNDNPDAVNDTATTIKNTGPLQINVLSNDLITPDAGETLTITAVTQGSSAGTIEIINNGTAIRYTHASGFTGSETFTYTISDGNGGTDTATVTVTVQNFIPSDISGYVFIDAIKNSVRDASELGLAGVTMTLTGKDINNTTVSLTAVSDKTGYYKFINVPPGTFTINQGAVPLMVDGPEQLGSHGGNKSVNDKMTFTIAQDSHLTNYNFGEYGPEARFVSIRNFFTSTPRETALAVVNSAGTGQWVTFTNGWAGVTQAQATLNSAKTQLTIAITDGAGAQSTAVVPVNDSRVQVVSNTSSGMLFRLVGPQSAFAFTAVTSGQGEAPDETALAASSTTDTSSQTDDSAENDDSSLPDAQPEPPDDISPAAASSSDYSNSTDVGAYLALQDSPASSTDGLGSTSDTSSSQNSSDSAANLGSTVAYGAANAPDFGSDGSNSSDTLDDETTTSEESSDEDVTVDAPVDEHDAALSDWEDDSVAWTSESEEEDEFGDLSEADAVDAVLADELWLDA